MGMNFPNTPSEGATYTSPNGAQYTFTGGVWMQVAAAQVVMDHIQSTPQDMWAGFQTGGEFVVNSKVDGSGDDVFTVGDNGAVNVQAPTGVGGVFRVTGGTGSASTTVQVNKPESGDYAGIMGLTNGLLRWLVQLGDSTAESGSNAGSSFFISRYNDSGGVLSTPFQITRSSGSIAQAPTRVSDNGLGAAHIWHSFASVLLVDYAGPAANNGIHLSNRNTSPTTTNQILFGWVSGNAGTITSTSAGNTSYGTSSDVRTKSNVREATQGRALVDALKVIEYDPEPVLRGGELHVPKTVEGVEPGDDIYMGISAQQAYSVYPLAVIPPNEAMPTYNADLRPGDDGFMPWMIDYSKFVPMLLANVQENNKIIDELKARLAALEGVT